MKKTRFIELLNLYVDQEISVEEAAQLEAEIARSNANRQIYNQYCKLQRGCVGLFESANAHAPAPQMAKLLDASQRVEERMADAPEPVAFDGSASVTWWRRAAMGGAMAASLALVGVVALRQSQSAPSESPPTVATTTAVAAPAETTVASNVPVGELVQLASMESRAASVDRESDAQSARSALFLRAWLRSAELAAESRGGDYAAVTDPVDLEWTRSVTLAPIQRVPAEQLRFESRATLASPAESRTFRGRGASAANVELSAFQFQR